MLDRKIRYCSLPEAVRDHFLWGARSIVIAGTHGKTTTTSLTGWVLAHGGADPSVFIGGIAENFESSYRVGGGREFVIEGDEYDSAFFDKTAKFLKYLPDIAVVNNIEFDHADIYPDLAAIRLAFQRLRQPGPATRPAAARRRQRRGRCARERARCRVETFGLTTAPTGRRTICEVDADVDDVQRPARRRRRSAASRCRCSAPTTCATRSPRSPWRGGRAEHRHDARGAAARSRASAAGMELRGTAGGVSVYDDFAHHPTAIAETLAGVRSAFPERRIWAIFEPRSATSCRRVFQDDFARALAEADT